ncbi:mechanosensitive ion channel family protein [Actinomyces bowdenii]|uniref:Mechanosensitive ion channel family protein n=1 Tax=Actinomyces bowdenii TaxID=131109 RepID=A0A3P1V9I1_9ACTO|nr:mechanosensitive ion channel domain-containing protein [Actinomyces bowdenii]RRD30884.1 mechanosensitive ion channel family protein [Actinomyces bowdenii]
MLRAATAPPDGSTPPVETPTPTPTPSPTSDAPATPGAGMPSTTPTLDVTETVEVIQETTVDFLTIAWKAGLGALIGLAVVLVVLRLLSIMGGRRLLYAELARFGRTAGYAAGALTGAYAGAQVAVMGQSRSSTHQIVLHALLIAVILAATWLAASTTRALETTVVKTMRSSSDVGRSNRVTTQAQILRRVVEVIVIVLGLVGAIMTFPSAHVAMGSLFASAGLVSVIAGLAARSTLSNVFAGVQLATTDAIRVGDLVVAASEQGTIEEITLAYVVLRTWDERRVVLPSTYFTENPFENWSRGGTQVIGHLDLDLDWRAPIAALRAELARIVAGSTVWDGRQAALEVANAVGGTLSVRITLSGKDSGDVGALKAQVREGLVDWLQREAPYALPRTRVEVEQVEVARDLAPEQVARMAEELVARQRTESGARDEGEEPEGAGAPGQEQVPALPAHLRAVSKGRSLLRRARRGGLGPR